MKLEKLFGCYPHGLAGIGEITHRRAGTRAGLEWNTDVAHREFDPTEGLHYHYFVKPAEMADAESLSIELIKPCALMTSLASKPSGTKTVVTVSEYHSEPYAQMRKPHASTAARTPLASRLWREKTFSKPSSSSISTAARRPRNRVAAGV